MISDDERHEVVARLRELVATPWYELPWSRDAMQSLGEMVGAVPGENIVERIADLIDRPTCQNKQVVYNRTAPKEFRTDNFTCSACGETFCADGDGVNHPIDWAFCPNCGAEVLND